MKKFYFLTAFLLLSVGMVFSQATKVTTGTINVQQGDYEKGVKNLNLGLSDLSLLKSKHIPKGFYYLGEGYMGILAKAKQEKNPQLLAKYPNCLLDAYGAYKSAKEHDDGKWGAKTDARLNRLFPAILAAGNGLLTQSYKMKGAQQEAILAEAKKYLEASIEMTPTSYMAHDLFGQAQLLDIDTTVAMTSFNKAIKLFATNPPSQPDQFITYTYYRLALLSRYKTKDLDAALKYLEDGKVVLDAEHAKMKKAKDKYAAEDWEKVVTQYDNASKDLNAFELDIYLASPDKLEAALAKFDKAVADEPDNYIVHVAYASLLEKTDEDKAIEIYQKAIAIDPKNEHAYFNLGALYNNIAKVKYDIANDEKDYEKADLMQKEVDEVFKLALPNFEKAFELNPSLVTVRALKQITIRLNMMDDYNKYKEAEKTMTGG